MEPFRWRRAFFVGLVSYAASLAGLVFDTFVPVLLQAGHPLWRNDTGLHASLGGFGLAPSLAFFIMTWDNLLNIVVHPWAGVRSDHTWTRWGRRKPWILVGVPLTVTGLLALPLAPTLAGVLLAILVTNVGRALFVPPMVAWLGDLFPAAQRSQAHAAFGLVSGVAGLVVEATGSQRTLFMVAAVAVGIAWLLLQRVHVETVTRVAAA